MTTMHVETREGRQTISKGHDRQAQYLDQASQTSVSEPRLVMRINYHYIIIRLTTSNSPDTAALRLPSRTRTLASGIHQHRGPAERRPSREYRFSRVPPSSSPSSSSFLRPLKRKTQTADPPRERQSTRFGESPSEM